MNRTLAAILVLASVPAVYGQGAVPVGGEFQVNSYVAGDQYRPSVASLAAGGFVTTWFSEGSSGSDSSGTSIQAQRYAADGTPLGGEFQVNAYTSGDQRGPSVAAQADGSFMVVWYDDRAVRGRPYAADGSALAGEFLVASSHPDAFFEYGAVSVAPLADGDFVVVWGGDAVPEVNIRGRRYAGDGSALGPRFTVGYDVDGDALAVAGLADGDFVVVWNKGLIGYDAIKGRRYSGDSPEGSTLTVNSSPVNGQTGRGYVATAGDSGGGFVVTWSSEVSSGSDASETSIQARRFAADSMPSGLEFQVNTYTANRQRFPVVASADSGGFVIAWQSEGSSGSDSAGYSIQGQRYAAGGQSLGGEFQLNSHTAGHQRKPSLATLGSGDFVAVWQSGSSNGSDSSGTSVQSRRFAPPRYSLVGLAGKCLDVEGGVPVDGTPVNLFLCHGGDNQRWQLDLAFGPQRVKGLEGKCLVPGFVDAAGTRVVIGECGGDDDLWRLAAPDHARPSVLIHADTGKCLDVAGGADADGTPVTLDDCHGGANQLWRPAAEVCTRDSLGLCLNQERFRVDLAWRSFDGTTGTSSAVPVGSNDSGLLWFFEADNWEMLIKVLDGCHINERFWLFAAATTTVEYTLTVTDTALGTVAEYFNPLGTAAAAITDTGAFATCPATSYSAGASGLPRVERATPIRRIAPSSARGGAARLGLKGFCTPSDTNLCLSNVRFRVEAEWRDPDGNIGSARAVPVGSDDSGLLWFFNSSNWEMLVKVLDACHLPDARFLMLAAATTDVEYTLRVTDTFADDSREYFNPQGNPSAALVDEFRTCPQGTSSLELRGLRR